MKGRKPSVVKLVWAGLASGRLRVALVEGTFKPDALEGLRSEHVGIPGKLRKWASPMMSMMLLMVVPILTMLWLGAASYSLACVAISCEPLQARMVNVGREESWDVGMNTLSVGSERIEKVMKDRAYAMGRSRASFEIDEDLFGLLSRETQSWLSKTAAQESLIVSSDDFGGSSAIARSALDSSNKAGDVKMQEQWGMRMQSQSAATRQATAVAELKVLMSGARFVSIQGDKLREAFSPWSIVNLLFSKTDRRTESIRVAGSKGVDVCIGWGAVTFIVLFAVAWRSWKGWHLAAGWARAREMELSMDWEAQQLMMAALKGKKGVQKRL